MKTIIPLIGSLGGILAVFGIIAYSLAPDNLWLVTLLEGAALVCLIVFFVTHFEAVKAFSVRRSTQLGVNSLLMIGLFVGVLAILNFLAARHSVRWDFSETERFTLAPQTHEVLDGLTQEVKVTVFTKVGGQAFTVYRDVLETYRQATPLLTVEYVDPERRPALARRYGITRPDVAVVEAGSQSSRVTAPSEAEITAALIRTTRGGTNRVVFLEGHGERALDSEEQNGYALAKEKLVKQGYEVGRLLLLQLPRVPEDTTVLVIAGPSLTITPAERDRIRRYVDDGGRLLVMVDPDTDSGLEPLLASWGVELGDGVLVDVRDRLAQGDLTALLLRTFTEHEITKDFNLPVLFPVSRHLTFDDARGTGWEFVPLVRTSPSSWAETNLVNLQGQVVRYDATEDLRGPLPVAAALKPSEPPKEGERQAALVVIGNSAFAANAYVNFPGNTDFLLSTIGWLAGEEALVSITPKTPAFRPYVPNPTQDRLLLYVQVLLLPALTFIWGVTIWKKRKRL